MSHSYNKKFIDKILSDFLSPVLSQEDTLATHTQWNGMKDIWIKFYIYILTQDGGYSSKNKHYVQPLGFVLIQQLSGPWCNIIEEAKFASWYNITLASKHLKLIKTK